MEKSYRVHTNVSKDTVLNVNMKQDFDFLEVLSLKLDKKDTYKIHSSNYGVIVGRVLANDAFGIPNAKLSVFIERDDNDSTEIESIYPYGEVTAKDREGRRYNILPDYSDDECYRVVGTFPNKKLVLDNSTELEIYEKYWKYTTVTNSCGDYMIFGVPSGTQTIHVDIDLSDIGILSQTPTDLEYSGGYGETMFDSPKLFKKSTNLESLSQIISQNKSVFVYPFWGDTDDNGSTAAITRSDVQVQYKFETTCVFLGSIVSDNGHAIGHKCAPSVENGMNDQLVTSDGTIEMIRKTVGGFVEEYPIKGNMLINNDGVWCYQIPMNLDYIGMDEYGNIIPTDNPNKGIATRAQVRFRISKNETSDDGFSRHTAKYLVPMNPTFDETKVIPHINVKGGDIEKMYEFGSSTPQNCFRDLYWNNVYSVKNYIPKTQVAHKAYSKNYSALKGSNYATDQNPIPFNKLMIDLPFTYMIVCILYTILINIITAINRFIVQPIDNVLIRNINRLADLKLPIIGRPFKFLHINPIGCIPVGGSIDGGNVAYFPGCGCPGSYACRHTECPDDMESKTTCEKSSNNDTLMDLMQQKLGEDFKVVRLDLHQDWVNGCLYMPIWRWRKRKKKKFLGITISKAKNEFCSCDKSYNLKSYVTCNVEYEDLSMSVNANDVPEGENKWHKNRRGRVRYRNGLIKPVENKDGLTVYYYSALQATLDAKNVNLAMSVRPKDFPAIRLYATDIILLGNLKKDNLYGIPQFFNGLPSTTANVPPIATIEESLASEENEGKTEGNDINSEDSGFTITTGMDWGHDGKDKTPNYKTGLFMDLACLYANTKAKACFNVERLSELGVNLDMSYDMSYAKNNNLESALIESDGFVTKLELDDMENRAMFATMNHIGFIPQDYQDSIISGCTTQVMDENTNYLIPKFKYMYLVDFDGRMQKLMSRYKKDFKQAMFDEVDEQYLSFRLGAEKNNKLDKNSEKRIRHFYLNDNGKYSMPLYNNSFYFYFGLKPGSTAIDKFNEMFNGTCYFEDKKPFSVVLETQGRSYCVESYDANTTVGTCSYSKNYAYGYIRVTLDDIKSPYSYDLYDSSNVKIVGESGMTLSDFVIGGTIMQDQDTSCVITNEDGRIMTQMPVYDADDEETKIREVYSGLTNQTYTLEIVDSEGKKFTEKVALTKQKISAEFVTEGIGTKFYDIDSSRIDFICNDKNNFYGKIMMNSFNVDGYDFSIVNVEDKGYDSANDRYRFEIYGKRQNDEVPMKNARLLLFLQVMVDDSGFTKTQDCLCDERNLPSQRVSPLSWDMVNCLNNSKYYAKKISLGNDGEGTPIYMFQINVYQPSSFNASMYQVCGSDGTILYDNSTSVTLTIQNGENFNAYLNTMPIKFILGTTTDNQSASIANNSHFYRSSTVTNPVDEHIVGWYGVHQEDSYSFLPTTTANEKAWSDFIDLTLGIENPSVKRKIIQYKFNTMFALSDATYVTTSSYPTFEFSTTGGGARTLYRTVSPYYDDSTQFLANYVMTDYNTATLTDSAYPNVVSNTYSGHTGLGPLFNKLYTKSEYIGNYFAAFSANGGYINNKSIDCSINVSKSPSFATPHVNGGLKQIGKDVMGSIESTFKAARETTPNIVINSADCVLTTNRTQPYLRALYVDRRFDFDLTVLAPYVGTDISLHNNEAEDRVWKSCRIYGHVYNGIEMSYDEEYNIISADTRENQEDGIVTSATFNNKCEYTYTFNEGNTDAVTRYNDSTSQVYWNKENVGYDATYDNNGSGPFIKQFYETSLDNFDLRNFFWSTFNKNRLKNYFDHQQGGYSGLYDLNLPIYVYGYPFSSPISPMYNGDFNRNSMKAKNYPTIRYIDVGNIPPAQNYTFSNTSCSYAMNVDINQDGSLTCKAKDGEFSELNLDFTSPIKFISPNANNEDYGNIVYKKSNLKVAGYSLFESSELNVAFKFNVKENSNFDVYPRVPLIIKVLKKSNDGYFGKDIKTNSHNIDGITYYKTASYNGGEKEVYTKNTNVWNVLHSEIKQFEFLDTKRNISLSNGVYIKGEITHNGRVIDGTYFYKDGSPMPLSDGDFDNVSFQASINITKSDSCVFAIIVDSECMPQSEDLLSRRLRTVECSDLLDARHVLIKGQCDNNQESYVQVIEVGGGVGTQVTKAFTQVLRFRMAFTKNGLPSKKSCQAFADYTKMAYKFKFTNRVKDYFYVDSNEFYVDDSSTDVTYIDFVVRWTQEMGIMADDLWKTNTLVEMFARTASNFTYKLSQFRLTFVSQEGLPKESMTVASHLTVFKID